MRDTNTNLYDKYAESYDRLIRHTSFYQELLEKVAYSLRGCDKIIDVAGGTGILAEKLALEGKIVYLVDGSKGMISYARKKLSNETRIHIFEMEAGELKFDNELFDGVALINALCFMDNPTKVLKEIYRVLKPGGIFVTSGPKPDMSLEKLTERCTQSCVEEGVFEQLKDDMRIVAECSRELVRKEVKNLYYSHHLSEILIKEILFAEIIATDDATYANQSHFVVAKK